MPHLRASALEEDPLGCALLLQVLHSAKQVVIAPTPSVERRLLETRLAEAQRERPALAGPMPMPLAPVTRQNRNRQPSRSGPTKRSA
jgi:hypothetical protein